MLHSGSRSTGNNSNSKGNAHKEKTVATSFTELFSSLLKNLQEEEMDPSESLMASQTINFDKNDTTDNNGNIGGGEHNHDNKDYDKRKRTKSDADIHNHEVHDDSSSIDSSASSNYNTNGEPQLPDYSNIKCQYESIEEAMENKSRQHQLILWIQGEIPLEDHQTAAFTHPLLAEAAETIPEFLLVKTASPMPSSEEEQKRELTSTPAAAAASNKQQPQRNQAATRKQHNQRNQQKEQHHQTVQILDLQGRDILVDNEKMGPQWTKSGVATLLIRALEYCKAPSGVPKYLSIVQEEEAGRYRVGRGGTFYRVEKQALFSTKFVFTSGEAEFAAIDGVISTKAGYVKQNPNKGAFGRSGCVEAVRVTFDSSRLAYNKLVKSALKRNVADICFYRNQEEFNAAHVEIHSFRNQNRSISASGEVSSSSSTASEGSGKFEASPTTKVASSISSLTTSSKERDISETLMQFDPSTMIFEVSEAQYKMPLRDSVLARVPLTELQAARANRFFNRGESEKVFEILSPQQRMIMARREYSTRETMRNLTGSSRNYVGLPIDQAWQRVFKQLDDINDQWRNPKNNNDNMLRQSTGRPEHKWARKQKS